MKHFFLGIFLIFSGVILAQESHTIRGTVKDFNNGETVFGASVFLKGTTIGATTNEYGFYSITAPKGNYTLIVSYVGFEDISQEISLNIDETLNFEIKESLTQLDEVLITSDEPERVNIKKPQMSVSKLNASTIKQMPAVLGEIDVIKSIQMLPGVTNGGEGSAGFNVRGGAADQNLVLLD